jgi:hypothetical protein
MRVLGTPRVSNQSGASRGQEMCRCWCSAHSRTSGLSRGCRAKDSQRAAGATNHACSSLRPSRRRRCSDDIRPTRGRPPRLVARRLAGPPVHHNSHPAWCHLGFFYARWWPRDPRLNLGFGPCGPRPVRYQISTRLGEIHFLRLANAAEHCLWLVWWPLAIFWRRTGPAPKTTCEFLRSQMHREANALSRSAEEHCLIVIGIDIQLCLACHLHYFTLLCPLSWRPRADNLC